MAGPSFRAVVACCILLSEAPAGCLGPSSSGTNGVTPAAATQSVAQPAVPQVLPAQSQIRVASQPSPGSPSRAFAGAASPVPEAQPQPSASPSPSSTPSGQPRASTVLDAFHVCVRAGGKCKLVCVSSGATSSCTLTSRAPAARRSAAPESHGH